MAERPTIKQTAIIHLKNLLKDLESDTEEIRRWEVDLTKGEVRRITIELEDK